MRVGRFRAMFARNLRLVEWMVGCYVEVGVFSLLLRVLSSRYRIISHK